MFKKQRRRFASRPSRSPARRDQASTHAASPRHSLSHAETVLSLWLNRKCLTHEVIQKCKKRRSYTVICASYHHDTSKVQRAGGSYEKASDLSKSENLLATPVQKLRTAASCLRFLRAKSYHINHVDVRIRKSVDPWVRE